LNDLERRNSPYFAFFSRNSTDFQADYITVVEDRPMASVNYCLPVLVYTTLAKTITHPAARSLCDSWASCLHLIQCTMKNRQCTVSAYKCNIIKICSHSAIGRGMRMRPSPSLPKYVRVKMALRDSEQCNKALSIIQSQISLQTTSVLPTCNMQQFRPRNLVRVRQCRYTN